MGKRKKITTRDIAEYTGLSQSTVSMILSHKENVSFSKETQDIVLQAAKKLGYKNEINKSKSSQKDLHQTIVVIAPHLSNSYYATLIHSIVYEAKKHNYSVFTITTMRNVQQEDSYYELLSNLDLAGIIYLYPPTKISKANALFKRMPVVSIGDKPQGSRFDSVELNGVRAGHLMGEYLLNLGHEKITFISAPVMGKEISRIHRYEGLIHAFEDQGKDVQNIQLKTMSLAQYESIQTENIEYQVGYELTMEALEEGTDSTAFLANNDMTALGVLSALKSEGYKVPKDFSVAGFDNILMSSLPDISLTTIEHATFLKGKEAVDIIYKKHLKNNMQKSHPYILRLEYEPELIIRKTTGKPRK